MELELAVHAWAVHSPVAARACALVHARRIAYLAALRPGERDAVERAELEYAALIGALHVFRGPRDRARRRRVAQRAAR